MRSIGNRFMTVFMATVVLAASGCAGSESKTEAPAAPQPAGSTTSAPKQEPVPAAPVTLNFGAGATGGNYFILGGALGKVIEQSVPGSSVTVAAGSNSAFIREGKDLLFTQPDSAYYAWAGVGGSGFKEGEKYQDLRFVAIGFLNTAILVAPAKSPINKISDLTENSVIGVTSAEYQTVLTTLLEAHGVKKVKMQVISGFDNLMTALRQNNIQLAQIVGSHPLPGVLEASKAFKMKTLPLESSAVKKFVADNPFSTDVVKAGTYDFVTADYPTWGRAAMLAASVKAPEAAIYTVTKLVHEKNSELATVVPVAKDFNLENLQKQLDDNVVRIPIHPGTLKYLQEKGIKIPASVPKG